ncbi:MAG: gluconolaconase [Acidobacteria bacterium]|nr:gluconolaconase [Acidobacteriota bacterium]
MSLLDTLLHSNLPNAPRLASLSPEAAMPGGEIEITGTHLAAVDGVLPLPSFGDTLAPLALSSFARAIVRIPEGVISSDLVIASAHGMSNRLPVRIATPLAENVHPVANPAVDTDGNIYTTLSGPRGQQTPVSIFRIDRSLQMRPFARDILNPTGLAFDAEGYLYCSSRAEGTVYRISPAGAVTTFVEGMGIATGLAFDKAGNLFVGDRSGTIFKVSTSREIYVHATLEPSVAAYHLAVLDDAGTLIVSAPNTASHDAIYSITPDGEVSTWFRGLGRPQGMAISATGDVYIAASYMGRRGIIRITAQREASLVVSGQNVLGIAFTGDGIAALATRDALYQIDMQTEGRGLI